MAETTFAEPQLRERLRIEVQSLNDNAAIVPRTNQFRDTPAVEPAKIEVFPAGADKPVLVKERGDTAFKPVVETPRPPHSQPHALPPMQETKLQSEGTIKGTGGRIASSNWKIGNQLSDEEKFARSINRLGGQNELDPAVVQEISELVSGVTIGGLAELMNSDRNKDLNNPFFNNPYDLEYDNLKRQAYYDTGRGATHWAKEHLNNAWDNFKDNLNNLPDFHLPEIKPPNIHFPEIHLPEVHLPEINLPKLDPDFWNHPDNYNLPNFQLPNFDFNPFNQTDKNNQDEVDRLKDRENERRSPYIPSDEDNINNVLKHLPNSCYITFTFVRYRYITTTNAYDYESIVTTTNFQRGRGDATIETERSDAYGNKYRIIANPSGNQGYSLYYNFDRTTGSNLNWLTPTFACEYQVAYHTSIPNTYTINDLFKFYNENTQTNEYIISPTDLKNDWGLDSYRIRCFTPPKTIPYIPPLEPKFPSNNPPPLPPQEKMDCCSCSDIALIFKKTLQSMKYAITIPIVTCVLEGDGDNRKWTPKVEYRQLEVFAIDTNSATAQAELHRELAIQAQENCENKNLISKTAKLLGEDDYPLTVPETLIENTDTPNQVKIKEIKSLTQFIHWYVERFDEIVGQWEIPIEIKDTDPNTPGDQSKLMKFPNMAEILAEMVTLLFQISINSELLLNINTRTLIETGQDKRQNFITYHLVHSIIDYLGFKQKDTQLDLPLMFTPEKKGYEQMLQEIKIPVPVPEFDEKFNLQADLMRFRKAASIIDSVYFKKVDSTQDIKGQLLKRLLDLRGMLKDINQGEEDDDFKEFLEAVEKGFGIGNPARPYGKDYEDRPRFRDLTEQQNSGNENNK